MLSTNAEDSMSKHQELENDPSRFAIVTSILREFPHVRVNVIDWLYRFHTKEVQEHLPVA